MKAILLAAMLLPFAAYGQTQPDARLEIAMQLLQDRTVQVVNLAARVQTLMAEIAALKEEAAKREKPKE